MKRFQVIIVWAIVILVSLFSAPLYAADGLIKQITFTSKGENSESVIFHLNGPWLPKAFAIKGDSPRVVFDFLGSRLAQKVSSSITPQGAMIQKIRTGVHSDKVRVVLDLVKGSNVTFDQQFDELNNTLTIHLFSSDYVATPKETPVDTPVVKEEPDVFVAEKEVVVKEKITPAVSAEKPKEKLVEKATVEKTKASEQVAEKIDPAPAPAPVPLLSEVSFENTSKKGEMVLFKLNGFFPPAVSGNEDGTPLVICDFSGASLGDNVVKDQQIHGEFVQRINVHRLTDSDMIRVTLELVPKKSYDLQQVFFKEDNLFVIIVNSFDTAENTVE